MALLVSTRVFGKRKPLLDDFGVPPPAAVPGGDDLRLRDVIEHVVRHEVDEFKRRQSARRFDRVLSGAQIAEAATRGKVDPASKDFKQGVDMGAAVGNALQAFEDGLYLVIIDEVERRSLDEPVRLAENSRLVFIRLTFLAGA
ncbi:MAG: hypothetical protein KAV82_03385 [Phycisphaerae bacterium]|nr:hypothetical protein [Phycisphaerae bacterium]